MIVSAENRQHLTSNDERERSQREADARYLVDSIVGKNREFFASPENRLDFLQTQDAEGFYRIAQHVNARLRSEKPRILRQDPNEKGAFLPMLHTPSREDKIPAFQGGYRAIQEYIADSPDSVDKKITSVAMATEALVIWTHPFNDGNGRTSRFLAKMIEDGATDIDDLVEQTVSGSNRGTVYDQRLATKEGVLQDADNEDIILDDDERDEMRVRAQSLPNDIDGMYLSVKRLLENEDVQRHSLRYAKNSRLAA